jgi:hypothetical protein
MSSNNFNINEPTYYESNGLTLLFGTIETNASPPNAIYLPPLETNDCHIILSKEVHPTFKTLILEAPITNKNILTYDQLGHLVGRYEIGRKNNSSGNLSILSDSVTLLSNIVFPKTSDTNTIYLPLTNYRGLFQPQSLESRRKLFEIDISEMQKNVDSKRIHLLISSTLIKSMEKIVTMADLTHIFGKVTEVTGDCISYLIELICGKTVSGNNPIFQGLLNFGDNIEVLGVKGINNKSFNSQVQLLARRNGRIQITVNGQNGSYVFMAILKKKVPMDFDMITEEITNTKISINSSMIVKPDTFGFSTEYIDNYIKALEYRFKLSLKTDKASQLAFVERYPAETIKMLFKNNSVIPDFDFNSKHSFTKLVYSEYGILMTETVKYLCHIMTDTFDGNQSSLGKITPRCEQYHTGGGAPGPPELKDYLESGFTHNLMALGVQTSIGGGAM